MELKEIHQKLVYCERALIVLPITCCLAALFLFMIASYLLEGILISLLYSPLLVGGMCLGHIFRFFKREVRRGFIAPFGVLLGICYGVMLAHIWVTLGTISKTPLEGWLYIVSSWCFAIIGIHWLLLFAFGFKLPPQRKKPSNVPDNLWR